MINKIISKVDEQGRILIPRSFLKYTGMEEAKQLALCQEGEVIKIRKSDDVENQKVIALVYKEQKGRITLPSEIRKGVLQVQFYLYNHELVIEEVP